MNRLFHFLSVVALASIAVVANATTVKKTMVEVAEANSWKTSVSGDESLYTSFKLDEVVSVVGSGEPNCGSFWGSDWRFYQAGSGAVVISVSEGYVVSTITFTYNTKNTGTLVDESGAVVASGAAYTVNGTSASFAVANTKDGVTNGQVRLTEIEVVYTAGQGSNPNPKPEPEPVDISNTIETAYTPSQVIKLIDAGEGLDTEVYVKGVITSFYKSGNVPTIDTYGQVSYFIRESVNAADSIEIYGGLNLDGEVFNNVNEISVGDNVVVLGTLTKYKDTYEVNKRNKIVQTDHKTTGGSTPVNIENTVETAYDVPAALKLIAAGESLATKVYVKGIICEITEVSVEYGNATYAISEDGDPTSESLLIYRGKNVDNEKFYDESEIGLGDEVVVYGNLTLYIAKDGSETNEMASGNYIVAITKASALPVITVDDIDNGQVYNLQGQKVNANAKGILIKNGKKYVRK